MRDHGGIDGTLQYVFGAAQEIGGRDARLACAFGEWIAERRSRLDRSIPDEMIESWLAETRNIREPEY